MPPVPLAAATSQASHPMQCRLARGGEQPKSADQQRGRARSRPQGRLLLLRAGDLGRRMAGAVLGLTETATDTFLLQMTYLKC
uniref:Uncharacterized protein n=1 Tax=Aegilops tauschii subsp. strangulata TaxID=200361 RepID=A0A452YX73_AEGTS